MSIIISSMFSGLMVVIGVTGLSVEKPSLLKRAVMGVYVFAMSLTQYMSGKGTGIPMLIGLILLIILASEKYRLENVIMAGIGHMLSMLMNSLFCLGIVAVLNFPLEEFVDRYGLLFYILYTIFLWLVLRLLRYILYEKMNLAGHISSIPRVVRYGLFVNVVLYMAIFLSTIMLGQWAGYSARVLGFNCLLFVICMLASSLLIAVSASSIRSAEQRKAEEYQKGITENYVASMEHMVDELRAFKHDYKNIIAQMAGYIREGDIGQLKEYYQRITQTEEADYYKDLYIWRSLRNIQPMEIKGVLYEKILRALSKKIEPEIRIEDGLEVRYPDIQVINRMLGIFIDNAIEAAAETEPKKLIIEASSDGAGAVFTISNSYRERPDLSKIFQKGVSTKGEGRGLGLYWVKNTLKEREELVHEMTVEDELVVQRLDIPENRG